jgi:phosphate transport system permease protein
MSEAPRTAPRQRRSRKTRFTTRLADFLARIVITLGGIGTIFAVSLVCLFLIWVVLPLFRQASLDIQGASSISEAGTSPIHVTIDEYRSISLVIFEGGRFESIAMDSGRILEQGTVLGDQRLTAFSYGAETGSTCFGFADGSVRLGHIGFDTRFFEADEVDAELRGLAEGERTEFERGVVARTPEDQFRIQTAKIDLDDPIIEATGGPVVLVGHVIRPTGPVVCTLNADGRLQAVSVRERRNMMTGETVRTEHSIELPYEPDPRGQPSHLITGGLGDNVYLAWPDGRAVRINILDLADPYVAESIDLIKEEGVELTQLTTLLGGNSLIAGDSIGRVGVWFLIKPEEAETRDGAQLVQSRNFQAGDAAISALASSRRSRTLAAGCADGMIRLFHVTSGLQLVEMHPEADSAPPAAVSRLAMAPKDDGLAVIAGSELYNVGLDLKHAEVSAASLFRPVWYEGYAHPAYVWQSSSGTDDFEPKFSLIPLIFGTIKATLYSLLFGVPLALLAAVYTSEFMNPKTRTPVKTTVELMASLPSVVLGFLAALVFAPFVERVLPVALAAFITLPFFCMFGAYLWQLLPRQFAIRMSRFRLWLIGATLPAGVVAAMFLGPLAERLLFGGDFKLWLNGQIGGIWGGWMLLFLPLCALFAVYFIATTIRPMLIRFSNSWTGLQCAAADLALFFIGLAAMFAAAGIVSFALSSLGLDPRGTYVDAYIQRNALVVGFVMGFAIIPIIYTISEDALSSVPEHLRSASLAAGATPWQTAVRIVIPTAMSGLFSAVMIGMGRAVGETMIVLMAAGNTPIMEWNIFNGFRTLSANIAVEMPEAVRNSTHFRILFLAALVLFFMTFIVNTVAEIVRLRFRKRAYQL